MTLDELLRRFTFGYHATRTANLLPIVAGRRLLSPAEVYRLRGTKAPKALRRSDRGKVKHIVPLPDGNVYLSDHDRLHEGNVRFEDGWDLGKFIERLNGLVFFWPGDDRGPIHQGLAHRDRYAREGHDFAVLRAPLRDLSATPSVLLLSSCNSGAPRHHPKTRRQPRGTTTFQPLDVFPPRNEIVEIAWEGTVALPNSTEHAASYAGPWRPLSPDGNLATEQ